MNDKSESLGREAFVSLIKPLIPEFEMENSHLCRATKCMQQNPSWADSCPADQKNHLLL